MKKNLRFVCQVLLFCVIFILIQHCVTGTKKSDNKKTLDNIAVAAVGKSDTSDINDKAARAFYFLIFDSNGVFVKAIKNPARDKKGGASSVVTNLLKKESVEIFIAKNFGNKMKNNLNRAHIEYQEHTGNARKIVENFIKNMRSKNEKK